MLTEQATHSSRNWLYRCHPGKGLCQCVLLGHEAQKTTSVSGQWSLQKKKVQMHKLFTFFNKALLLVLFFVLGSYTYISVCVCNKYEAIYISLLEAFGFCSCFECCRMRLCQCCNHEPPLSHPCQGNYVSLILKINIKQCISKIYLKQTIECSAQSIQPHLWL